MDFKELFENYKALCYIHEGERKTLEAKHKEELKVLQKKHYEEIQGLRLCDYFQIGDTIELDMIEYLPTRHYKVRYIIVNKGEDYLVAFDDDNYAVDILHWEDFIDARSIHHNGKEINLDED